MSEVIQHSATRAIRDARTPNIVFAAALLVVPMTIGCSGATRHSRIRQWGTLREVLAEGQTHERCRLGPSVVAARTYGVGAVTGLKGEITILDGVAWVSYADESGNLVSRSDVASETTATFLATAKVGEWRDYVLDGDVRPEQLEQVIAGCGKAAGLNAKQGFPFVVEGTLAPLELHVINGRCPHSAVSDHAKGGTDPIRIKRASAGGTLVGFYVEGGGGVLTHRGSRTHVHVLVPGDPPVAGHVDTVGVQHGGRIRVPGMSAER